MRILEKIIKRQNDNHNAPVTIAFLGDSVTQGCFEIYTKNDGKIETVFDKNSAYHKYFAEIFAVLCPNVPINIINAGVSGASATFGLENLEEFVLRRNPDLTVVCFGLNDSTRGEEKLNLYINSLSEIFDRLRECGSEIIFMTPNMMCTEISRHITDEIIKSCAERIREYQVNGSLDLYVEAAKELCEKKGIVVSDCYKKWKRMSECGLDVTELLANKINHPTRRMNWLFAYSLVETIFNAE